MRGTLARSLGEAASGEGAEPAEAAVGADGDLRPDGLGRLDLELRTVAGLGRLDPAAHGVERLAVLRAREELPAEQLEPVQAMPAEVVLAALQHGDANLASERGSGDRHVLRQQLLLERLRRRRDDHAPAGLERRDQVGEALARPCPRLGEEVLPHRKRRLDGRRQCRLLRAELVAGEGTLEGAARAEDRLHAGKPRDGRGRRNTCSCSGAENCRSERIFRA